MDRVDVSRLNEVFGIDGPKYITYTQDDFESCKVKPIVSVNSSFKIDKIERKNTIMIIKNDDNILYERKFDNYYKNELKRIEQILINIELNRKKEYEDLIKYQEELKIRLLKEYNEEKQKINNKSPIKYCWYSYLKSERYFKNIKINLLYEKVDYLIYENEFTELTKKVELPKKVIKNKLKKEKRKYNPLEDFRKTIKKSQKNSAIRWSND